MDVAKPYKFPDFVTDRRRSLTSRTIAGSPEGPKYLMLRSAGVCEINAARMNLPCGFLGNPVPRPPYLNAASFCGQNRLPGHKSSIVEV